MLPAFRLAWLAPLVLSLSACAVSASVPPSELTLHGQDSGRTVAVHPGDTVKLDLLDTYPVPGSSVIWTADTSDASVLARLSSSRETPAGIAHSQAHYTAVFKALKQGTATVWMTGAARCEAMNPAACPQPSGSITVTIS